MNLHSIFNSNVSMQSSLTSQGAKIAVPSANCNNLSQVDAFQPTEKLAKGANNALELARSWAQSLQKDTGNQSTDPNHVVVSNSAIQGELQSDSNGNATSLMPGIKQMSLEARDCAPDWDGPETQGDVTKIQYSTDSNGEHLLVHHEYANPTSHHSLLHPGQRTEGLSGPRADMDYRIDNRNGVLTILDDSAALARQQV